MKCQYIPQSGIQLIHNAHGKSLENIKGAESFGSLQSNLLMSLNICLNPVLPSAFIKLLALVDLWCKHVVTWSSNIHEDNAGCPSYQAPALSQPRWLPNGLV